jgi:hypothetical protein
VPRSFASRLDRPTLNADRGEGARGEGDRQASGTECRIGQANQGEQQAQTAGGERCRTGSRRRPPGDDHAQRQDDAESECVQEGLGVLRVACDQRDRTGGGDEPDDAGADGDGEGRADRVLGPGCGWTSVALRDGDCGQR